MHFYQSDVCHLDTNNGFAKESLYEDSFGRISGLRNIPSRGDYQKSSYQYNSTTLWQNDQTNSKSIRPPDGSLRQQMDL